MALHSSGRHRSSGKGANQRRLTVESLEDRRLLAIDVHLLKDLTGNTESSFPTSITPVGNRVFFVASTAANGTELWRTNGTSAGTVLVKDIRAGAAGSYPTSLTDVNGTLFFAANDGIKGLELWRSDGTSAGTRMVRKINTISNGSTPEHLTNVNGTLFFAASNGTSRELWKSDGTFSGTVMVRNLGPGDADPSYLANAKGTLYFQADDGVHGAEIWKSDGTSAGTKMVSDLVSGPVGSYPSQFTEMKGLVYFRGDHGAELWRTANTPKGAVLMLPSNGNPIDELINHDGTLFFTLDNGNTTRLVQTNGNIADLRAFNRVTDVSGLTSFNDELYFAASGGETGIELWKSDGTDLGTFLVKDIRPQEAYYGSPIDSSPRELTNVLGTLFFSAVDGVAGGHGRELWMSDGTRRGTVLVKDTFPGEDSGGPVHLVNANGVLYFAAQTPANGTEPWRVEVNADPTITFANTVVEYRENASPRVLASDAVVTDLDGTTFNGARLVVRVRDNYDINDRLSISPVGNEPSQVNLVGKDVLVGGRKVGVYSTHDGGRTLAVTFNSTATLFSLQAVARRAAFRTLGEDPYITPRGVTFQVIDSGGARSEFAVKTVNVTTINDDPRISLGGTLGYERGSSAVTLASGAGVSDPDALSFGLGRLTVAVMQGASSSNRLEIGGAFKVIGTDLLLNEQSIGTVINTGFGTRSLAINFKVTASVEIVQQLIRSIRFRTTETAPLGDRLIGFTLTDGNGGTSNTAVKKVTVT